MVGGQFPGVRALVDVIGQLEGFDFNLMFRLLREGVTAEQLRKWYWEREDYLFMAPVHTVIDIARFTFTWRGRVLIARAFPDTSTLQSQDLVLIRKLPASKEYITIIYAKEMIYYGVPKERISFRHEAELWRFDGTDHTLTYTTALAPAADMEAWITCIFYVPRTRLVYFTTYIEDSRVNSIEDVKLYRMDPSDYTVTEIPIILDSNTNGTDIAMPPVFDAAYFNGDIYLVQGGIDDDHSPSGSFFPPRVYRFDLVSETLTQVFIHPQNPDGFATKPSIAVYGNDEKLLFSMYHNVDPTGRIYQSTDGVGWSLLATIDNNAEVLNMMTDRTTKRVYISVGIRPVVPFGPDVWVYDGVNVSLDYDIPIASWTGIPSLAAAYNNATRTYLWGVNDTSVAGKDVLFRDDFVWASDPFDISSLDLDYEATTQTAASIGGKMLLLAQRLSAPTRQVALFRDLVLGWQESKTFPYLFRRHVYEKAWSMCRAGTSVLPHEQ